MVEDAFADILSIDEHGNLDFSVNITNPNDVKTLFSFFSQKMTSQDLLLRSCTSKEINRSYRTEFYSGSKFHFLIPMDLSFFCRRKPLTILWKQQNPMQSWISQNLWFVHCRSHGKKFLKIRKSVFSFFFPRYMNTSLLEKSIIRISTINCRLKKEFHILRTSSRYPKESEY